MCMVERVFLWLVTHEQLRIACCVYGWKLVFLHGWSLMSRVYIACYLHDWNDMYTACYVYDFYSWMIIQERLVYCMLCVWLNYPGNMSEHSYIKCVLHAARMIEGFFKVIDDCLWMQFILYFMCIIVWHTLFMNDQASMTNGHAIHQW